MSLQYAAEEVQYEDEMKALCLPSICTCRTKHTKDPALANAIFIILRTAKKYEGLIILDAQLSYSLIFLVLS